LFDRYRIPYPKPGLSWSELFELARRFPAAAGKTGDVYGFHPDSSGFGFVMELAQAYGINPISNDGTRVDVHSGSWRSIWTAVLDGYRGGVFSGPPDMGGGSYMVADWVKKHPFMLGQSAMALGRSNYTSNLLSYLNNFEQYGLQPFKWGAIPAPTDPSTPGASRMYAPLELFAVSAASSEKEEAWKLVAAVSSNETVQYRMKTQELRGSSPLSVLPARSEPAIKAGDEQLKPFYELAAVKREDGAKIDYSNPAYREFSTIVGEEYKRAEAGQETLDEMIGRIEQRMQPKLTKVGEAVSP
jgi:multiple sugar transport system substrate-binding protein